MTYRLRNIVIAVVLAAFAALLTMMYVTSYEKRVQNGEEDVAVLFPARMERDAVDLRLMPVQHQGRGGRCNRPE